MVTTEPGGRCLSADGVMAREPRAYRGGRTRGISRLLGDDDGEYFSRVVAACDGVRFVPESKIFYRRVASNRLSHVGLSNKKLEAHFLAMQLQVRNICALEDSTRVRSACLKFLQRFMIYFYPQRPDIVEKLQQIAD